MNTPAADRNGSTVSLWMDTDEAPTFPPLDADASTRVCIVGAGIAGLTTAYRLAMSGIEAIVLDQHGLLGGQSARSTGHLCDALDDRYFELEKLFGEDGARRAAQSHAAAVDEIERICGREGIACDFARIDGYLVRGEGDRRDAILGREYEAACRAGLDVERVLAAPGALSVFGEALRFPNQARFHVVKYLAGLARAFERLGGRIHGSTTVASVAAGDDTHVATAEGLRVDADHVVVATNVPFNDRLALHTKQAAYRTYVLALRIPAASVPDALLWDTLDPYHYLRIAETRDGTWLLVGGEDRKTGQDDTPWVHFEALESWARAHFPMAGDVGYRWSGQVIEPVDSLAFIGRNPGFADNIHVATGDSGNGLTHGTIAGLLLADLIGGRESPWRALYAPNRHTLRATGEFLRENLNFVPYYGELVGEGDHIDIDDMAMLEAGSAAILRHGLHKIAAYRDDGGALHLHSAVCPHLGCVVHWNGVERSWDCPCHGSRFDAQDGSRLNGPADRGLAPIVLHAPPMRIDERPALRP